MTSPALIRADDLKRMSTIAKSEGVTVWIETPDGELSFIQYLKIRSRHLNVWKPR